MNMKRELEGLKKEIKKTNKSDHFANAFGRYYSDQKKLLDEYNKKKSLEEKKLIRDEKKQKLALWKETQKQKLEMVREENKALIIENKKLDGQIKKLVKVIEKVRKKKDVGVEIDKAEGTVLKVPHSEDMVVQSKRKEGFKTMKKLVNDIESGVADDRLSAGIDNIKKVLMVRR